VNPPRSARALVAWAADTLGCAGVASPELDAGLLLAHATGVPRLRRMASGEDAVNEVAALSFESLVRRRATREPLQHILGSTAFLDMDLLVDGRVLVPRPETEGLVVRVLDLCRGSAAPRIVDVGTGSGAIAIAVAKNLPQALLTATDSSGAALAVAAENAVRHGVADRITFHEGDLLGANAVGGPWDVVVSNPPYIRDDEVGTLPRDVREHEPRQALVAGPRGVEIIERLAAQAAERLAPGGWLVLEAGPTVAVEVERILAGIHGLVPGPTLKDLAGLPRVFQAYRQA